MKKKIAFASIFDLTEVFYAIAEGLTEAGHEIFWITTDHYWAKWLQEKNVDQSNILELAYSDSDYLDSTAQKTLLAEIVKSEANADLTANQSLLMDQFVEYKNRSDINEFVYLYYRDIKRFLTDKQVTDLVAEPTNTNEMITYMVCRELGIRFISPRDLRYPGNRVIFFDNHLQGAPLPRRDDDAAICGKDLIDEFASNKPTPFYFEKHNRTPVIEPKTVMNSLKNRIARSKVIRQTNLTHHDLGGRIKLTLKRSFNSRYMKHICRYDNLDDIKGRVAFYGLHVQPESSIDVLGSYFSDQLKLTKDIRRALPFDTTLVVKEHPNFLGIKNIGFFRSLRRIPNTKLLRHDVSAFDIYNRSDIVFTVSGTTAYEAGMLGIPAVTFSEMYFDGLSSVHYCSDLTKLRQLVFHLLDGFKRDYKADCTFMEKIVKDSYDSFWTDPLSDPRVMEPNNIKKLRTAFLKVMSNDAD
jgi:hypothetical protein